MGMIDPQQPELGEMPLWDLSDLYPGRDSAAYREDLARSSAEARAFRQQYEGRIGELTGAELGAAVAAYERIEETLGRMMTYAYLGYTRAVEDTEVVQFYQAAQEQVTEISRDLLFFTLGLRRLDEAVLADRMKAPELAKYAPWLRDLRVMTPHQLSDELESYILDTSVVGAAAWNRLFDETMAGLRFTVRGQDMRSAQVFHLMSEPDRALREDAATEAGRVLGSNIRLFSLITNTLAKDKEISDRWRRFKQPQSSRHRANLVEDEVVDALHASVKAACPRLSHRYYAMKAKWLGLEQLEYWDRNAPLPEAGNRLIPWAEAREMVLGAYRAFSPELANTIEPFFSRGWIDAPVYPGKESGAFSHPSVPSVHPYILMNYQGRPRDVMTLAHELGHGAHQVLAGRQGHLIADTPLTLAETASVFGEMLTFRSLLAAEQDVKKRKALLAGKVEDMLNTVVRQIAFYDFELQVHHERRTGELSADRLGDIWMEVSRQSLGPAIRLREDYRHYWAYISHFIHAPFYVYAYAFGDCLVNSLYATYQQQPDGFQQKYLAMLSAGGRYRHQELLAPFGLDATDPDFWQRGLNVVAGLIDELEAL